MENFIAEIRMFPAIPAIPNGWALCDGTLLLIQQNKALFTLLGVQFGGNGTTNFALPDLRGRIPMGTTPGGEYLQGAAAGTINTTLTLANLPAHHHFLQVSTATADVFTPENNFFAVAAEKEYAPGAAVVALAPNMLSATGNAVPVNNIQPYLGVVFAIALTGIFPPIS